MKRELKFKAWHIEQKQMYWFDLMWGNHGKGDGYIGMVEWGMPRDSSSSYSGNQTLIDPNNCELMQYTGLKENANEQTELNKEIYEGDIVEFIDGERLAIEWNDDTCQFQYTDGSPINDNERYATYKKIIGNIYEGLELLETKKDQMSERKAE